MLLESFDQFVSRILLEAETTAQPGYSFIAVLGETDPAPIKTALSGRGIADGAKIYAVGPINGLLGLSTLGQAGGKFSNVVEQPSNSVASDIFPGDFLELTAEGKQYSLNKKTKSVSIPFNAKTQFTNIKGSGNGFGALIRAAEQIGKAITAQSFDVNSTEVTGYLVLSVYGQLRYESLAVNGKIVNSNNSEYSGEMYINMLNDYGQNEKLTYINEKAQTGSSVDTLAAIIKTIASASVAATLHGAKKTWGPKYGGWQGIRDLVDNKLTMKANAKLVNGKPSDADLKDQAAYSLSIAMHVALDELDSKFYANSSELDLLPYAQPIINGGEAGLSKTVPENFSKILDKIAPTKAGSIKALTAYLPMYWAHLKAAALSAMPTMLDASIKSAQAKLIPGEVTQTAPGAAASTGKQTFGKF